MPVTVIPVDAPVSWSIREVVPPVRLEAERLFQLFPAAPLPKEKSIRRSKAKASKAKRKMAKKKGRVALSLMSITYTDWPNFNRVFTMDKNIYLNVMPFSSNIYA